MNSEKDAKQQDLKKNPFTLRGFMNILQGKPAENKEKPENKEKK